MSRFAKTSLADRVEPDMTARVQHAFCVARDRANRSSFSEPDGWRKILSRNCELIAT